MGSTIVVANRKGGSGKTTSTINIADGLARQEKKVLVVDADSQAQATISCGILPYRLEMSIYELLHIIMSDRKAGKAIDNTIIRGQQLFDIIPSKPDLSALDIEAADTLDRHSLLKDLIMEVSLDYDYILIDLPPSLGLITVNGLVAGDSLIIPVEPTFLSMDGLAQMTGILYKVNAELNPDLRLMGILPIRCDLRTNLARSVVEEIRGNFGEDRLLPPVRNDIKLAEAPSFGKTIFDYAFTCRGAWDYLQVVNAILARSGD
ncbi:MAG: ParA family protein [Syntrophomonas sp.]